MNVNDPKEVAKELREIVNAAGYRLIILPHSLAYHILSALETMPTREQDLRAHIDRLSQRCGFPIVVNLPQVLETIGNKVERLERDNAALTAERDALAEKLKACEPYNRAWEQWRSRVKSIASERGHHHYLYLCDILVEMDSLIAPADAAVEDKPGPPMEPTDVRHAFEQLYECWNYGELDDAEFMAKFADLAKEQR